MKVKLPKGSNVVINGLEVECLDSVTVEVAAATNEDQAAGLAAAHGLPIDMEQFDHEEEGVNVSYAKDGTRLETVIEVKPVEEKEEKKKANK